MRGPVAGHLVDLKFMETAHKAVATKPTFGLTSLWFQRDVATSALTVDAYQNFLVRP
jgi:hypothetical protein